MFPLQAIINTCVALRIHPNTLTLVGVIINVGAAWALAHDRFVLAGFVMIVANIFDFIDGKVAHRLQLQSRFGAFWDSTLDRFSDLALLVGLIYSVFVARAQRLRPDRGADADLLDHDELRARARRVAGREMQGRLHGAAGADRAVHDRRVHRSNGRRALGDPGPVDPRGGQPDLLHLPRPEQPADADAAKASAASSTAPSSGPTSGPRSPTTCGWSRSWRSSG